MTCGVQETSNIAARENVVDSIANIVSALIGGSLFSAIILGALNFPVGNLAIAFLMAIVGGILLSMISYFLGSLAKKTDADPSANAARKTS